MLEEQPELQALNAGLLEIVQTENPSSSFRRGRCSCLKTRLETLFGVLLPTYSLWGPSQHWWHLWAHHAYELAWAVRGRSVSIYCSQWRQQQPTSLYFRYCTERWLRMVRILSRSNAWKTWKTGPKRIIMRAVVMRKVMVTTMKTMMINRRVSKLNAVHLAGEWQDLCFNKLKKRKIPGLSRVKLCSSCTFSR